MRTRNSKKDRQHNGQKKRDKRTNNDLQNITQKTKDRTTRGNKTIGTELLFTFSKKKTLIRNIYINIVGVLFGD